MFMLTGAIIVAGLSVVHLTVAIAETVKPYDFGIKSGHTLPINRNRVYNNHISRPIHSYPVNSRRNTVTPAPVQQPQYQAPVTPAPVPYIPNSRRNIGWNPEFGNNTINRSSYNFNQPTPVNMNCGTVSQITSPSYSNYNQYIQSNCPDPTSRRNCTMTSVNSWMPQQQMTPQYNCYCYNQLCQPPIYDNHGNMTFQQNHQCHQQKHANYQPKFNWDVINSIGFGPPFQEDSNVAEFMFNDNNRFATFSSLY